MRPGAALPVDLEVVVELGRMAESWTLEAVSELQLALFLETVLVPALGLPV